jgi:non-canonical purine NTP pyrophosphatase (RdgB/HAM1 family)
MSAITFITGNPAKAEQLGLHLDMAVSHHRVDLPEVQSLDLAEIIEHKALAAHAIVGGTILVEDTSLRFSALGQLPGPLIKWFFQELGNEGLSKLLDAYEDRSASATVCFGLYDGDALKTFTGEMDGRIAERPRGNSSFGWDPIFIPAGNSKTWGEMSAEEQAATSMRRLALAKLTHHLQGS